MGYLYLENAVVPVTGEFTKKRLELETKSCVHCQSVIAILVRGCTTEYQSKYTCMRCHGSVCKRCAAWMREHGGVCPGPFMARIEAALKANNGHLLRHYVHNYRC